MAISWRKGLTIEKDPDDIIKYVIDYTDWLPTSVTVSSGTVTPASGLTLDSSTNDTTTVTGVVSGGTDGTTYDLNYHMVASDGQELNRTIRIKVRDH